MSEIFDNLKIVFSKKRYTFLFLGVAFLFYMVNVLISNYSGIYDFYREFGLYEGSKFFINLGIGFGESIETHSYVSLIVISILIGILISLISFRIKEISLNGNDELNNTKTGILGSFALFLGVLVPGCAACGIGIVSALGLGGAFLIFLPFQGLEISILAIGLLGFSIYKTSKDLTICRIRKININKMKGGKI